MEKKYNMSSAFFMKMLCFVLKDCTYFTANDCIYKQLKGLPMGGIISPIVARIVIERLMSDVLKIIQPAWIYIYVDGTICAIKKDKINDFLIALNSYHESIKFTIEMEKEQSINFLNLTAIRQDDGSNITNWYPKPFASHRLLNFYSDHERTTISNTAIQLMRTTLELSDGIFFHKNQEIISTILRDNNWPETEIIRLINEHYTLMKPRPVPHKESDMTFSLPRSNDICHKIKKGIEMILPTDDLRLVHTVEHTHQSNIRTVQQHQSYL